MIKFYNFIFYILLISIGDSQEKPVENLSGSRKVISLNRDWKFIREDVLGADKPGFDDSQWQDVGLPHCYNDQDVFNKHYARDDKKWPVIKVALDEAAKNHQPPPKGTEDEKEGGNKKSLKELSKGSFYGGSREGDGGWNGKTWYRKHFKFDQANQGLSAYLEVEAARTVAQVWLNGKFLGKYVSGFSSFAFDITKDLLVDQENVLAIQVDDTEGENICAGNASHWQPILGGLYRNVRLHLTDPLHVTLPYYSFLKTEGVYLGVTKIVPSQAEFRMTTEVVNQYAQEVPCDVTQEILDADGKSVLKLTANQRIPAQGVFKFDQTGNIPRPKFWSVDDPYLYQVVTSVLKQGKVVDQITTPLGVRSIGFDNKKRTFLLNGKPLLLTGYGQKPNSTWPGLGSGLPDWLFANDIRLMKESNANIVRWGHCAGPVPVLNEGDRIGFLNWQPNISGESDYEGEIWKNKMDVFRDVIIRDRNHPSVVFWEGNNRSLSLEHTKEIRDLVSKWDCISPRPCTERGPYTPDIVTLQAFSMGMNGSDYVKTMTGVESEYYRPENPRRCWDGDAGVCYPYAPTGNPYFKNQLESCREFLKGWINIARRGGGVKWHFTDDCTHMRVSEYAVARLSGAMDASRLPKDMYYALQVMFANPEKPSLHLMGHWNYEDKKSHTIDVYSNCDEVELFLNDQSLGKKTPEDRLTTWENVKFEPGKLKAVGYVGGSPDAFEEKITAGSPASIKLEYFTNPHGMKADRSDVAIITATVVDKEGNEHPLAEPDITFAVSGPGNYRGGFSDHLDGMTGKTTLPAEAGKIRVAVRSTNQAGKVTVTASSEGLQSGSISFDVLPAE